MIFIFTPFSFIYSLVYFILFLSLWVFQDFFSLWVVMELIMLSFMGISYSLVTSSISSLMQYFLIQAISSFSLLVFFSLDFSFLFTAVFFLKLSMFPFHSWYLSVVYRFPNFILFLASSFHKFPPLLLLSPSCHLLDIGVVSVSIFFTFLVSAVVMLFCSDLRLLLVASSVGNNSWFFLSGLFTQSFLCVFLFVYSLFFYMVLASVGSSTPSPLLLLSLLSLSGLPPFPVFFFNAYLLFSFFSSFLAMLMLLLVASAMVCAYVQAIFSFLLLSFSSPSSLFQDSPLSQ